MLDFYKFITHLNVRAQEEGFFGWALHAFMDMISSGENIKLSEKTLIGDRSTFGFSPNIVGQKQLLDHRATTFIETLPILIKPEIKHAIRQSAKYHDSWSKFKGWPNGDNEVSMTWRTHWLEFADEVYKFFGVCFERHSLESLSTGVCNGEGPADVLVEGGCFYWMVECTDELAKTNAKPSPVTTVSAPLPAETASDDKKVRGCVGDNAQGLGDDSPFGVDSIPNDGVEALIFAKVPSVELIGLCSEAVVAASFKVR